MQEKKITPIHYQDLIRVFERAGFTIKREKGDHIVMTKPGVKRPVVIKSSPRLVPVTHIRTNMTTAGLNRESYFHLLNEVMGYPCKGTQHVLPPSVALTLCGSVFPML
jgi:predicted RNA binding protein YcfA (HicA-like mRNA interferase family)